MIIRAQLPARLSRIRLALPLAKPSTQNLAKLAALVESGSVTPIVDKVFTFDNAAAAIRYLEVEHARAKVIIGFS
jgi:NADPH:quinone reductase-like Zn-dependent oxidoreductase